MLNRLPTPTQLPPLQWMLDDIGNPTARALARALGVTPITVKRWRSAGTAPRPVLLAIFWLTRWGMSVVHCEAENAACLHAGMAVGLRREVQTLNGQLAQLGRIADFGSANDPAPGVALPSVPTTMPTPEHRATAQATGRATAEKTQQPRGLQRG